MKKILFLNPNNIEGSPAFERMKAFSDFYKNKGINVEYIDYPKNILELVSMIVYIYKFGFDCLFVSQPPFKYLIIFFLPFVKKILDYRDGWSIAIKDGYGGLVDKKPLKATIAKIIEYFAMKKSDLVITCTPGLHEYLSTFCNKKLLMIPNGISKENYELITGISDFSINDSKALKFYCAGKFSEYGINRVKITLDCIKERYKTDVEIHLIGCDVEANIWLESYVNEKIKIIFYPRMGKKELYLNLNRADFFLSIVRDEKYELGTKIFEYIAFNKPVLNYFTKRNSFTEYFDGIFDFNFSDDSKFDKTIIRDSLISEHTDSLVSILK